MADTFYQENLCLNKVAEVVSSKNFQCKFIPFTGDVDNGLDGVILWRKNGTIVDTVYVQCKGGDSYLPELKGSNYEKRFKIKLSKEYVKKHYPIWNACSSPVILVVCNSNKKAWWADLKSVDTYNEEKDTIYLEPNHLFKGSAKAELSEILRNRSVLNKIPPLHVYGTLLNGCLLNAPLKKVGKEFYKSLSKTPLKCELEEFDKKIEFSRVGWMHITRKSRKVGRVIQSIMLLPVVPEILKNAKEYRVLTVHTKQTGDSSYEISEKLGIVAECYFSYRFPCIAKVVLLRKKYISPEGEIQRIWFYSVYELSRDKRLSDIQ